jgi:hypothetical protein
MNGKRLTESAPFLFVVFLWAPSGLGAEQVFQYKAQPGQVWVATERSETRSEWMGNKSIIRDKTVIKYEVTKAPKPGWATVTARVLSKSQDLGANQPAQPQTFWRNVVYTASLHRSGEVRDTRYSSTGTLDPASKSIVEGHLEGIFWFPEFPEHPLRPGDEFDVTRKQTAVGTQTVSRTTYTLEEVRAGLAYFSTKIRVVSKVPGPGGPSEYKQAWKGEAIFDIAKGMWTELSSRSQGTMAGQPGSDIKYAHISKISIEQQ